MFGRPSPTDRATASTTTPPPPTPSPGVRPSAPAEADGRTTPSSVAPGGPSAARSRPSGRGARPVGVPFFDARPVLGQPPGDGLVVALAVDAPGLLRGVAALPQPGSQVVGVEANAELLLDQLGQAWGGPQLGGEAVLRRVVGQPAADDLLLGGGQLRTPSRDRLRRQASGAVLAEGSHPTSDGAPIDANEVGHFPDRVSVFHALHGQASAKLQDSG